MIFAAYALYAMLAPSLPLTWPLVPLDLWLIGAAPSRRRAATLLVGTAVIDALLGTPSPWPRWALRAVAVGLWGRGPVALPATVFLWCILLAPGRGPLHLVVLLTCSALLSWRLRPAAPPQRRRWGWHE